MYSMLNVAIKRPTLKSAEHPRTQELAKLLVHALGYDEAVAKAQQSHWHNVADTIRFLKGETLRRY